MSQSKTQTQQQVPPEHQAALQAAGLNWGSLIGLALPQILALIQALAAAASHKAGGAGGTGTPATP